MSPLATIEDRRVFGTTDLSEFPTPPSEAMKAALYEAVSDNPVTKIGEVIESRFSSGRHMNPEEAIDFGKQYGVELTEIPLHGMNEEGVKTLVDRQYQKKVRQFEMAKAGGGFATQAGMFAYGLAGSAVDPLNVASAFIPVLGEAKIAKLLQGGFAARTAGRAAKGAIEGAVGAAAIEPLSYVSSKMLGDDYDSIDSLNNLVFGTVLGAGLHAGAGALGDGFRATGDFVALKSEGIGAGLSPEERTASFQAALAALEEDRIVQADEVVKGIRADRAVRLDIATQFDPTAFEALRHLDSEVEFAATEKGRLEQALRTEDPSVASLDRLKEIQQEFKDPKLTQDEFYRLVNEENAILANVDQEALVRARAEWGKGQKDIKQDLEYFGKRLGDLIGERDQLSRRIADAHNKATSFINENPDVFSRVENTRRIDKTYEPGAKFVDEPEIKKLDEELAAAPPDEQLEYATEQADLELKEFEAVAKMEGMDEEAMAGILDEINEPVKAAKEYESALESYLNCVVRGAPRGK